MRKQKRNPRQRSSKKERYKVINWPEYNRSLKNRGNLKVWIPKNVLEHWYAEEKLIKEKGVAQEYSDLCIEACLTIKLLLHLGYRQTEGFIESVFAMAKIDLRVPSYSVMCKRSKKIKVNLSSQRTKTGASGINVSIDSTGLKVYGEGEWKVRTHGWGKHRTWQKIHLAVNPDEKTIVACELTTNSIHDSKMVAPLLKQVKEKIQTFQGDGAYDKVIVYNSLAKRNIKPVIPLLNTY